MVFNSFGQIPKSVTVESYVKSMFSLIRITSYFSDGKLRFRKVMELTQSHIMNLWQPGLEHVFPF